MNRWRYLISLILLSLSVRCSSTGKKRKGAPKKGPPAERIKAAREPVDYKYEIKFDIVVDGIGRDILSFPSTGKHPLTKAKNVSLSIKLADKDKNPDQSTVTFTLQSMKYTTFKNFAEKRLLSLLRSFLNDLQLKEYKRKHFDMKHLYRSGGRGRTKVVDLVRISQNLYIEYLMRNRKKELPSFSPISIELRNFEHKGDEAPAALFIKTREKIESIIAEMTDEKNIWDKKKMTKSLSRGKDEGNCVVVLIFNLGNEKASGEGLDFIQAAKKNMKKLRVVMENICEEVRNRMVFSCSEEERESIKKPKVCLSSLRVGGDFFFILAFEITLVGKCEDECIRGEHLEELSNALRKHSTPGTSRSEIVDALLKLDDYFVVSHHRNPTYARWKKKDKTCSGVPFDSITDTFKKPAEAGQGGEEVGPTGEFHKLPSEFSGQPGTSDPLAAAMMELYSPSPEPSDLAEPLKMLEDYTNRPGTILPIDEEEFMDFLYGGENPEVPETSTPSGALLDFEGLELADLVPEEYDISIEEYLFGPSSPEGMVPEEYDFSIEEYLFGPSSPDGQLLSYTGR
jgi:hypothetical protein